MALGLADWIYCGSRAVRRGSPVTPQSRYFRSVHLPQISRFSRIVIWVLVIFGTLSLGSFLAGCLLVVLFPRYYPLSHSAGVSLGILGAALLTAATAILLLRRSSTCRGKRFSACKKAEILQIFPDEAAALAWAQDKPKVSGWFFPQDALAWVAVLKSTGLLLMSTAFPLVLFVASCPTQHVAGRIALAITSALDGGLSAFLVTGIVTQVLPWGGVSEEATQFQSAVLASDIRDILVL